MLVLLLIAIDLTVVMIAAIWLGGKIMAQLSDVFDSFNKLSASVQNLANAYQAKAAGIDPAALDPLKAGMDQLASVVDGVLAPPQPGS